MVVLQFIKPYCRQLADQQNFYTNSSAAAEEFLDLMSRTTMNSERKKAPLIQEILYNLPPFWANSFPV